MAGQFLKVSQVVIEILVPQAGAPASLTLTGNPPGGTVGVTYGFCFSASGGTPPYTWVILSGSIPPGTVLDGSGCITGVPTVAGTFCFRIQVMDSMGQTAFLDRCITIVAGSLIVQLIGWKLYPETPCGPAEPAVEVPHAPWWE